MDEPQRKFAAEPVVGVVIGAVPVVIADLVTWGVSVVAAHGSSQGAAGLLETFPVIAAPPVAIVVGIAALIARRPWIALGALIGFVAAVILLPGECLVGVSAGWIRIAG